MVESDEYDRAVEEAYNEAAESLSEALSLDGGLERPKTASAVHRRLLNDRLDTNGDYLCAHTGITADTDTDRRNAESCKHSDIYRY